MKALRNLLYLTLFFTVPSVLWAQYGGTQSIFSLGVGARALGLGSACVALPQDPTTIYWNPAGLDFLEQKGITF
ncbi:MAG: hypothetical protein ONB05_07065, partial [candidate division KSB1 bacterium]|nr:hypothetical protein [candidate division KSB1 bacterium]